MQLSMRNTTIRKNGKYISYLLHNPFTHAGCIVRSNQMAWTWNGTVARHSNANAIATATASSLLEHRISFAFAFVTMALWAWNAVRVENSTQLSPVHSGFMLFSIHILDIAESTHIQSQNTFVLNIVLHVNVYNYELSIHFSDAGRYLYANTCTNSIKHIHFNYVQHVILHVVPRLCWTVFGVQCWSKPCIVLPNWIRKSYC